MTNKRKEIVEIVLVYLETMLCLYLKILFDRSVMMLLPMAVRVVVMILSYWFVALVPIIMMIVKKEKISDYGFSREKLPKQLLIGVLAGVAFSLVFTLVPHLAGMGEFVDSGHRYTQLWKFCYEFVYCIFAVGLTEEFIFRGFFFERIKKLSNTTAAILCSSAMFGFFHIFSGNIVQVFVTALLGAAFCLLREKIKDCSIISLIVLHGIYDALIVVFASLLLN